MPDKKAKTPADRKADERNRDKKQGIIRIEVKGHPDDRPKIRAFAEKLLKKRLSDSYKESELEG